MAGKGSAPRKGRDDTKYASNWDTIFGNKSGHEVVKANAKEELFQLIQDYDHEVEYEDDGRVTITFHL